MSESGSDVLAAIDIGTNSVLLTVAHQKGEQQVVVTTHATVTRLGQGVDQTGELHPDAMKRTLDCLRNYRSIMDEHGVGRAHAVGTSAMRDAQGGGAFVQQASEVLGFTPEVISGKREAELTFRGALSGLAHDGPSFVFDIGGGSTELIVGDASSGLSIESSTSLNIGSVRLTERCAPSDPPTPSDVDQIRSTIRGALSQCDVVVTPGTRTVGVAGTVTSLAAIAEQMTTYDPSIIHGYELKLCAVEEIVDRLASMTTEQRRTLHGLAPGRADVIVAGSILCEEVMRYAQADSLIVSDRGVRFGLLADLAAP